MQFRVGLPITHCSAGQTQELRPRRLVATPLGSGLNKLSSVHICQAIGVGVLQRGTTMSPLFFLKKGPRVQSSEVLKDIGIICGLRSAIPVLTVLVASGTHGGFIAWLHRILRHSYTLAQYKCIFALIWAIRAEGFHMAAQRM